MWDDLAEMVRNPFVVFFVCVIVPASCFRPLSDSVQMEFNAYRLHQFDLQQQQYGSRSFRVAYEAAALDSRGLLRRCAVGWWRDLVDRTSLLDNTLGAALVLLPSNLDALTDDPEDIQSFTRLEAELTSAKFDLPVYFAFANDELVDMVRTLELTKASEQGSALFALKNAITANSFQIVSTSQGSTAAGEQTMYNIVGKLSAYERGLEVPTIAIVAHYDSTGALPTLAEGADSNGSGVAALLELMRIIKRYYQSSKSRARYDVIFVLSAGGKLNYQGARQWIEEQIEQRGAEVESKKLEMVMCLDSLALGDVLRMHVSKMPKEDGAVGKFFGCLQTAAGALNKSTTKSRLSNRTVEMVHKKINLAEEYLAWEHERFSIKRTLAFTLSHYAAPKQPLMRSILDLRRRVDVKVLHENVFVIAEALLRFLYELPDLQSVVTDGSHDEVTTFLDSPNGGVQEELLRGWLDRLTSSATGASRSRSAQSLSVQGGGTKHPLIVDLLAAFDHYCHEARTIAVNPDKKDPEYALYGLSVDQLAAYRVKPAVFELVLAVIIAAYLGLMYLGVLNVQWLFDYLQTELFRLRVKAA